ncbi:hypothetical protein [Chamaesiphon sp. OTE_20_metabat_361]|uniref:hypothetical protein n=1 Tax=Chamaesiphon sp. OTE_20_metabat_361 TaxID=2964689 RepID=UPI00286A67DC|nr:hypothetical protein [Chamaesiphon sp. OTE_20_metabat_361]
MLENSQFYAGFFQQYAIVMTLPASISYSTPLIVRLGVQRAAIAASRGNFRVPSNLR